MKPAEQPDFRLTLRPTPGDVPAAVRLRAVLKYALRACGLRCVRVEEVPRDGPGGRDRGRPVG